MQAGRERLVAALLACLAFVPLGASAAISNATDGPSVGATVDTGYAIVQLQLDPLAVSAQTKPPKGKKVDFSSATVKSYRALLSAQRNDYKQWLHANAPNAKVNVGADYTVSRPVASGFFFHAPDDAVWSGLERALSQWDGASAADALSRARVSWPAAARSRLDLLVHGLRIDKPLGPFPDLGASAPATASPPDAGRSPAPRRTPP
jgi:hypothetical protein